MRKITNISIMEHSDVETSEHLWITIATSNSSPWILEYPQNVDDFPNKLVRIDLSNQTPLIMIATLLAVILCRRKHSLKAIFV